MASTFLNSSVVVGTTLTDLYTVPALTKTVSYGLTITNNNATTTRTISVYVYDNSAVATRTIVKNLGIPFGDTYIHEAKINLDSADKLQVIVDAGTDCDAFVSLLEVA